MNDLQHRVQMNKVLLHDRERNKQAEMNPFRSVQRLFMLILAFCLLVQPFSYGMSVLASEASLLEIGQATALRGEKVSIPVDLQSDGRVRGLQFQLTYNKDLLTLVGIRKGEQVPPSVMMFDNLTDGKVLLADVGNAFPEGRLTLVWLDYEVQAFSQHTRSEIKISSPIIADGRAANLSHEFTFIDGLITVTEQERPIITGVTDDAKYVQQVTPNVQKPDDVASVTLTKDGNPVPGYTLGTPLAEPGAYVLTVIDKNGRQAIVEFTILQSVTLTGISLDLYQYKMEEGGSQRVLVTARYSNGDTQKLSTEASYQVGNSTIASINPDGLITGQMAGNTHLVVSYGGFKAHASIEVSKALASEAKLSSLVNSDGTLNPTFLPEKSNYKATVSSEVRAITVTATTQDSASIMTINGAPVNSGTPYNMPLEEGINVLKIIVTAPDGQTSCTYTLEVKKITQDFENTRIDLPEDNSLLIDPRPVITGFSETDSMVEVLIWRKSDDMLVTSGKVMATLNGQWSFSPSIDLPDGSYKIRAIARDTFGNQKESNERTITVDTSTILTLSTDPSAVVADGKSTVNIKATYRNADQTPIRGAAVTFSVYRAQLVQEAITDENGEASITLTAPELEGVDPKQETIQAVVKDDQGHEKVSMITLSYLPASVEGIVKDYSISPAETVVNASVRLEEDFNGDGLIDFTASTSTDGNGHYKIYVPKGNWTYHPIISFNKKVEGSTEAIPVEFKQTAPVGELESRGQEFKSNKNLSGMLLMTDKKDGKAKPVQEVLKGGQQLETRLVNDSGDTVGKLTLDENGRYQVEDIAPGKYEVIFEVKSPTGEKLAGQSASFTIEEDGELGVQFSLIDPYGIVSDKKTGNPIQGVKVSLYWADTDLNRQVGRVPDTLVPLPELPDFPPNQNKVPQWTNAEGEYAWMVFPDGDYYLIAEKNDYETFDSRKDPRNEQQGATSYIREGIIHVGESIVKYDLSMQPISRSGGGSGSSDDDSPIIQPLPAEQLTVEPTPTLETKEEPYVSGYGDRTFRPENALTRAEMAAILSRIVTGETITLEHAPYPDVPLEHWAAKAIGKVQRLNLMVGYPDGHFQPTRQITRAEMAAVAVNLRKWERTNTNKLVFPDTLEHWANETIHAVKQAGLMTGYPDGRFRPNRDLTRGEAVVVFNKLLGRTLKNKPIDPTFVDVGNAHWAFEEIEAAATRNVIQTFIP